MTAPREVDHGWWQEPDGRQSRLTWSSDGDRLYLFHADGTSQELVAGVSEADARTFVEDLWEHIGARTANELRTAIAGRWPS